MSKQVTHLRSTLDKDQVLLDIKQYLNEGRLNSDIYKIIMDKYPSIKSEQKVQHLITETRQIIQNELDFNIEDVMINHASKYDIIYEKNRNPITTNGAKVTDRNRLIHHYLTAMEALKRKEKLLGVVQKNQLEVELKNDVVEQAQQDEELLPSSNLDLSKLSIDEKKEILLLLKKAKGELEEQTQIKTTVTVTNQIEQKQDKPKYENVVDQFEVEDVGYEDVTNEGKDIPQVHGVVKNMKLEEVRQIEKRIKKQKLLEKLKNKSI